MRGFSIAKRYSSALWETASNVNQAQTWLKNLQALNALMTDSKELAKVVASPLFSFEKKQAVLKEILEKLQAEAAVKSFVDRVARAGRMNAFASIVEAFRQRVLQEEGVVELLVESALPLTDGQKTDLQVRFEKMTGKKVSIVGKLNPQLLAGMKVSFGGKTFDGSLKTHLANLEKHLLKEDFVTHATA